MMKVIITPDGQIEVPCDATDLAQQAIDSSNFMASQANDAIKLQIVALESKQTDRRIREALAGTDNGWLSNLNSQISALRAQLT